MRQKFDMGSTSGPQCDPLFEHPSVLHADSSLEIAKTWHFLKFVRMKEMDYWVFKTTKLFAIHCLSTLLYSVEEMTRRRHSHV